MHHMHRCPAFPVGSTHFHESALSQRLNIIPEIASCDAGLHILLVVQDSNEKRLLVIPEHLRGFLVLNRHPMEWQHFPLLAHPLNYGCRGQLFQTKVLRLVLLKIIPSRRFCPKFDAEFCLQLFSL